jgi:CRISPR-associated protein Cmr5
MQTRKQKYADQIYNQISALEEQDHQKYGTMALKLPALVRTAGLVQALTFVDARRDAAQKKLLDHLATSLGFQNKDALLAQARAADLSTYIVLTEQAMAALDWYKRYAQSVLKVKLTDDQGQEN